MTPSSSHSQCANCNCVFSCQNDVTFTKISFAQNVELDIGDALNYIYRMDPLSKFDSKYPAIFEFCRSCLFLLDGAYTALRHFENSSHINSLVQIVKDKYSGQGLSTIEKDPRITSPIGSYSIVDDESDGDDFFDEVGDIKYIPSQDLLSNNNNEEKDNESVEDIVIKMDPESLCTDKLVVKLERLSPDILHGPIPTAASESSHRKPAMKVKSKKIKVKESFIRPRRRTRRPATYKENEEDEVAENMKMEIEKEEDNAWSPSNDNEFADVEVKTKRKSPSTKNKNYKYKIKIMKDGSIKKVYKTPIVDVQCPICGKMLRGSNGNISGHLRLHSAEKPFVCPVCGDAFRSAGGGLNDHLRAMHGILVRTKRTDDSLTEAFVANEHASSKRVYYCEVCTFDFNYKYRFLRHLKDKHLNKEIEDGHTMYFYYCDFDDCKASFPTLDRLHIHMSTIHSSSNYFTCQTCQRIFFQESNLSIHSKSHEETNKSACKYCHMVFDTEMELTDHTPRHEIKLDMSTYCHVCDQCGEVFQNEPMLKKHHMNMHTGKIKARPPRQTNLAEETETSKPTPNNKVLCQICDKSVWSQNLRGHMYAHTNPEGFQCSQCTYKGATPVILRNHQIRDHPTSITKARAPRKRKQYSGANQKIYPKKPQNIPCEYCDLISNTRFLYRKHLVNKHSDKFPTLTFHCNACFSLFETKELLNTHIDELHERLKCKEEGCGKLFRTTIRLVQHLNVHYNNRPFKCPHCEATFTNQGTAFSHVMMVHEKYRSIRCKLCPDDQGFYRKQDFRKHVEKYHPGVSVEEIIEHKKHADKLRIDDKEAVAIYPNLFTTRKKRITLPHTPYNL